MPLIQGKSKKSFDKNLKTELHADKPKDQALAIAYSIQRKNKGKKMAKGGIVESAKSEMRPMPSEEDNDKAMIGRNSMKKPLKESDWTDSPTVEQAQRPSPTKMSSPMSKDKGMQRMEREDEMDIMDKMPPDGYKNQPKKAYDEEGADRQGPSVPDLKMKRMAKGGMVDMEPADSGMELMEREDESDLQRSAKPASPMEQPKKAYDEKDADKHDLEGASNEHYDSIADAILAKSRKAKMYAKGGMVDDDQVDLQTNANEDLNNEDDMSFEAARKDTYFDDSQLDEQPEDSNEHSDDIDADKHDMVESIRRKMKLKREI